VWVGEVLMDIVEEMDTSPNRVFSISCVDGLGKLSQVDYNNSGSAYSGTATLLDHLYNIINKTNIPYFYTTENFLKVVCNWYDDAHPYAATLDPLTLTRVAHKVFYRTDKLGNKKYMSCYQVLKNLAQLMGAKFYMSGGTLRFEQINERKDTQFTEHIYDKAGTKLSTTTTASNEVTINQSSSFARKTQGRFTNFPALKKVELFYKHEKVENLLEGTTWDNTSHVNFEVGDFQNEPTNFIFSGNLYFKTTSTLNEGDGVNFRGAFRIKFKWGTYWYSRDAINNNGTISFSNHFWSSSEDYYEISSQFINQFIDYDPGGNNTFEESRIISIAFETPALSLVQQSGTNTLDVDIELVNLLDLNGAAVDSNVVSLDEWTITDASLTIKEGSSSIEGGRIYSVSNSSNAGNTKEFRFETVFADGPTANSPGRLEVYNGSSWENSSAWKIDDTGDAYKIQELVIREILSGQTVPVKKYNGTIRGKIDAFSRLGFDGSKWLFIGGSFTANSEEWSGEWFHIAIDDTGVVIDPEEPVPTANPPLGNDTSGGDSGLSGGGSPNGAVPAGTSVGVVSTGITSGTNINQIVISPTGNNGVISTGTVFQVVSAETGVIQTFTSTGTVYGGDNTINVQSTTLTDAIGPGSQIVIPTSSLSTQSDFNEVFEKNNAISHLLVADDITLDTAENAGNGSTAGIVFNGDGIKAYNDSSSSPVTEISHNDGTLTTDSLNLNTQTSEPTNEGQLLYKDNRLKYYDGTSVKTVGDTSDTGAIYLNFPSVDRGTSWTIGYLKTFFVAGTDLNGKSIKKIILGMTTGPDGTGTTTIIVRKNGSSVITLSIITPQPTIKNQTLSPGSFSIASNDVIEFEVTALATTPPEGLNIILKVE